MFHLALRRSEVAVESLTSRQTGEFTVVQFIGKKKQASEIPIKTGSRSGHQEYLTATGRDIQSAGFFISKVIQTGITIQTDWVRSGFIWSGVI